MYSGQKKRKLIKPMVCVSTNGMVLDVFDPYPAGSSDGEIFNEIIKSSKFSTFFRPNDIFLFDKGFRESQERLRSKNMIAKILLSAPIESKTLDTKSTNLSRLVTKSRFVIEMVFGGIKKSFKIFTHPWMNVEAEHIIFDFKIAFAIHNIDTERSDSNRVNADDIIRQIKKSIEKPNN